MLTLARAVLYLLAAAALVFSGWVHSVRSAPHHHQEIAMPDPHHPITLHYLGYLPGAEALMVATEAPARRVYYLPRNLCGGVPAADAIGRLIRIEVSGWWLRRHGLERLIGAAP